MKMLLLKINYHAHCWSICSDFQTVDRMNEVCYFLCYWESRARDRNCTVNFWSERDSFEPGQRNIAEDPLSDIKNVILSPLHIKLGIVKNFVKAIVRNGNAFGYIKSKFLKISEAGISITSSLADYC